MGFLKDILGAAAPIVGGIFGGPVGSAIGGAAAGLLGSKSQPSSTTATATQQLDPRSQAMIYGPDGKSGLLGRYDALGQAPQNGQLQQFGQANLDYLSTAPDNLRGIQNAGAQLLNGSSAPRANAAQAQGAQVSNAAFAQGNMVNAPSQNNMDLSGSYDSFINGDRGGNTRLTSAIQGGIDQSKNMFQQMQGNATENLMENIMPSIRSNSVLSGQYGGSRQGIAEGNAIGDFAKAQQQTINQFGQNNTNAAVGAQANAYETDSNRALSATQGLGAQQYGVAQQDAATKNAAEFMNVNQMNQNYNTNAGLQQQSNLANAGFTQQANLANLSAEQQQNALNQNGKIAGAGLLGGQMGQSYGIGQGQDNFAIDRAQQAAGMMNPLLMGAGSTSSSTQPLYQNTMGNILGGATAGLSLYDKFKNPVSTTSPGIGQNNGMGTGNFNFQPPKLGTNPGLLQNMDWLKG